MVNSNKKRCLLLLTRYPHPPVGGDRVKSHNLVKILSKKYKLKIIVITDEKPSESVKHFLHNMADSYVIYNKPSLSFKINAIKGLLKKKPIQVSYYYFKSIHRLIEPDVDTADIVIANLVRTTAYINKPESTFLDIVDAIGPHYIEAQKKATSLFWKLIYRIEGSRLLKYEAQCVKKFKNTFFVNKQESEDYSKHGQTCWIPNGVNPDLFLYNSSEVNRNIAFFGKMDYRPNVEAVLWYLEKVHPFLPVDYHFFIVGTAPCSQIMKRASLFHNVTVTGFVENPYKVMINCAAIVAPMQIGGGIQNKVLESMALGLVNVLTTKAAKPIYGAIAGKHFVVEDEPSKMVEAIINLLDFPNMYENIGKAARQFIMENYTWENYESKLVEILEN